MLGCDSVWNAIYSIGSRLRPRRNSRFLTKELATAAVHFGSWRSDSLCGDSVSGGDGWDEVTSVAPHGVEDAGDPPRRQGDRGDPFAASGSTRTPEPRRAAAAVARARNTLHATSTNSDRAAYCQPW